MTKLFILFILFSTQSYAYTLNLPEQSSFANKNCSLELGNKSYRAARFQGELSLMLQKARLTTGKATYVFYIEEVEHKKNQDEFAQLPNEIFPTSVYIKKINVNELRLKAVAESWYGMTDLRFDCGVMIQK